jgi:integrase
VRERKDGRWEARYYLTDGRRRSIFGRTKVEASRNLAQAIHAAESGSAPPDGTVKVEAFLGRFLDAIRHQVRPATLESYESHCRIHIIPALGHIRLAKLSAAQIDALLAAKVEAGLNPVTVNRIRATLRRALGQAVKWGLLRDNVVKMTAPARERRFVVDPLTAEQARTFLALTAGDRLHPLWAFGLGTGLRQGEVLALSWDNVDLSAGTVRVTSTLQRVKGGGWTLAEPKSERSRRTISLPAFVVTALRTHRAEQGRLRLLSGDSWQDNGFVFTTAAGAPLNASNVTHKLQQALAGAGLPRQRFHDLRHAAATLLLAQGADMRTVMEVLGHSSIALTANTYSHVGKAAMRDAADKMEAALG